MGFKIITADQRLEQQTGIKLQVWGSYGVGKTSLLWSLDPATTLAIDLEAGMKAVQGWKGRSICVRTWEDCRDVACWAGGPNPALRQDQTYSKAHFDYVSQQYGEFPHDIKTLFVDSTSNASRYCLQWAKGQPAAFSERSGKPDNRGAYGLLAQEMVAWAEQLQHIPGLNVILVGGLEDRVDEFNRSTPTPLMEGAKGASMLPYVFDEIVSMTVLKAEDGKPYRALVCTANPWNFPAKDRSGNLDMLERPHLGELLTKIGTPSSRPRFEAINYEIEKGE